MKRCACRPGCLTWLTPGDRVTPTPDGFALTDHLTVAFPDETQVPEYVLSERGAS